MAEPASASPRRQYVPSAAGTALAVMGHGSSATVSCAAVLGHTDWSAPPLNTTHCQQSFALSPVPKRRSPFSNTRREWVSGPLRLPRHETAAWRLGVRSTTTVTRLQSAPLGEPAIIADLAAAPGEPPTAEEDRACAPPSDADAALPPSAPREAPRALPHRSVPQARERRSIAWPRALPFLLFLLALRQARRPRPARRSPPAASCLRPERRRRS